MPQCSTEPSGNYEKGFFKEADFEYESLKIRNSSINVFDILFAMLCLPCALKLTRDAGSCAGLASRVTIFIAQ
jgi:hypothetical protein